MFVLNGRRETMSEFVMVAVIDVNLNTILFEAFGWKLFFFRVIIIFIYFGDFQFEYNTYFLILFIFLILYFKRKLY